MSALYRELGKAEITLAQFVKGKTIIERMYPEDVDVLLEEGPTACPIFNGKICNGEGSGFCDGSICVCKGAWTGIACHIPPALIDFDPQTGTSEPNEKCQLMLKEAMKVC